jgi:hypothetical protein
MHTCVVQFCTCIVTGDAQSSESGSNIVKRHTQRDDTRHSPSSVSVVPAKDDDKDDRHGSSTSSGTSSRIQEAIGSMAVCIESSR